MCNLREKNGLQLTATGICFESAEEIFGEQEKSKISTTTILTLQDIQVLDKVEGSQHRYVLKKSAKKKADFFNFHFSSLSNLHRSSLSSQLQVYLPDFSVYLSEETVRYFCKDSINSWQYLPMEIIKCLVGEIEEKKMSKMVAYETLVTVHKKVNSLIKNPNQEITINLPYLELLPETNKGVIKLSKVEDFAQQLIFSRLNQGNTKQIVAEFLSQYLIVSDLSKFAQDIIGRISKASQTKQIDLELGMGILKDIANGTVKLTESTAITVVKMANFAGMNLNEQSFSMTVKQLLSRFNTQVREDLSENIYKNSGDLNNT